MSALELLPAAMDMLILALPAMSRCLSGQACPVQSIQDTLRPSCASIAVCSIMKVEYNSAQSMPCQ